MLATDSIHKKYLYILLAISIAAETLAITLLVLLSALDYIGFDGANNISATCPSYYYTNKYGNPSLIVQVAYILSILALTAFTAAFIIIIRCAVIGYKSLQSNIFISKCNKISLYVLTSLAILASIPPFGYYLSFLVQISNCTVSYNSSNMIAVCTIAAILLIAFLVLFVLLFIFFSFSQEKYREVYNHSTEPQERIEETKYINKKFTQQDQPFRKQPQVYDKRTPQQLQRNSPPKRILNRGQQMQHTKEHLFSSPSRQPAIQYYSKEIDPQPFLKPILQNRYEPTKTPAPILQARTYKKEYFPSEAPQKNISQSKPSIEGELIFERSRKKVQNEDDEDFKRQQNRYISKYAGRPILSSNGAEEVNSRYREELPIRNQQNSSPAKRNKREGNLLNLIRGKYDN